MGKKLFTLEEQRTQFEYGQHCFLEGRYTEAEFAFRHVIQSANEHNDFETVVSGMIWLNRTLINNSKVEQLFQ